MVRRLNGRLGQPERAGKAVDVSGHSPLTRGLPRAYSSTECSVSTRVCPKPNGYQAVELDASHLSIVSTAAEVYELSIEATRGDEHAVTRCSQAFTA